MPIIEVRALPQNPPADVPRVLGTLCEKVAEALSCEPDHVWATWETIPDGHYVEGTTDAATQPEGTHPPLVRALIYQGWDLGAVRSMLDAIATSLEESLGIEPGNVFIRLEEMQAGTVHAGGKVLE